MNIKIELHYLPCVHYFTRFFLYERVVIDDLEHFGRQSYRNRCYVAGANGILPLIIPVRYRGTAASIRQVLIDNTTDWQRIHWLSLRSAYGKAPYFDYYADKLAPFYRTRQKRIFDFTYPLLLHIISLLNIDPQKIALASETHEECVDFKDFIHPKKGFHNDSSFQPKRYMQAFEERHGFLPNLSIADVLFNVGPGSTAYIRSCIGKP